MIRKNPKLSRTLQDRYVHNLLRQLRPAQHEEIMKEVKSNRRLRRAFGVMGGSFGTIAASQTARIALGITTPMTTLSAPISATTVAIAAGGLYRKRARIINDYLKKFGPDAPAMNLYNMHIATEAVKVGAKIPPTPPNARTMEDVLRRKKILDLRFIPEAGKALGSNMSSSELKSLGITRFEKFSLVSEIKRERKDLGLVFNAKRYRFATIGQLKKEYHTLIQKQLARRKREL